MESARAHEIRQRTREARPVCRSTKHDERPLSFADEIGRAVEGSRISNRDVDCVRLHYRNFGRLFCGDVLGQLEMYWSRPFLLREPKGFADGCRNNRRADDLARHLC